MNPSYKEEPTFILGGGGDTKQQLKFVLIKEVLFWVGHVGAGYDTIKNDVHFVLK